MLYAVQLAMQIEGPVGMQWLILTCYSKHGVISFISNWFISILNVCTKKICRPNVWLWFLASSIGGVLAGLLGGEALGEGLESIQYLFMIQYYVVIGVALVLVAAVGTYLRKSS